STEHCWWVQAFRYAAVAVVAVGLTIMVNWLRQHAQPTVATAAHPLQVATLLWAEDCEWQPAGVSRGEGQRLDAQMLRLEKGLAVVRFDGGAAAILSGRTELELRSPASARLVLGRVTVRAAGGAAGFVLSTAAGEAT